jgi:hypothetical protein
MSHALNDPRRLYVRNQIREEANADITATGTKEPASKEQYLIIDFIIVCKVTILPWQNMNMYMRHSLSCFWCILQSHQARYTRSD